MKRPSRVADVLLQVMLVTLCASTACSASNDTAGAVLQDARLYVTAPVRWDGRDWLYAGGAVLAIAAAHHYDDEVRRHFADGAPPGQVNAGNTRDLLPAVAVVAGTWALALLWDDHAGYQETRNMVEAVALSTVTTLVLKQVVRRDRPDTTTDSNSWFSHGNSFPSGHVSVAMAVGTVLAESGGEDYRWLRRGVGYGLGAATAYARLKHQQHWLSDTVAGAALGMSTARFVLNHNRPGAAYSSLTLLPVERGLQLTYAAAFH